MVLMLKKGPERMNERRDNLAKVVYSSNERRTVYLPVLQRRKLAVFDSQLNIEH